MLLQPINVLLMDEPTNHLILNLKCFESSLQKIWRNLITSFLDRDFLQGMSNIVYEFKDQKLENILDINYFLEQRNMENMREVEKKT
jgi:ATP-binding cassette subfamily F protein 3